MKKKQYRGRVVPYVMADNESDARVAAPRARFELYSPVQEEN